MKEVKQPQYLCRFSVSPLPSRHSETLAYIVNIIDHKERCVAFSAHHPHLDGAVENAERVCKLLNKFSL